MSILNVSNLIAHSILFFIKEYNHLLNIKAIVFFQHIKSITDIKSTFIDIIIEYQF
jgi:hypothetical protein